MDIQHVSFPSDRTDAEGDDLVIIVDNETVIKVRNYATGEYQWQVSTTRPQNTAHPEYDPQATIEEHIGKAAGTDGYFNEGQSFGVLATWWEPKTWAHAVMNVINNQ